MQEFFFADRSVSQFLKACTYLNCADRTDRDVTKFRQHLVTFFIFLYESKPFQQLMKQWVSHGRKFPRRKRLGRHWRCCRQRLVSAGVCVPASRSAEKKDPESLRRRLRNPGTKSCIVDGIAHMFEDRWSNQRNSKKPAWNFIDEGDDDDNDVLFAARCRATFQRRRKMMIGTGVLLLPLLPSVMDVLPRTTGMTLRTRRR